MYWQRRIIVPILKGQPAHKQTSEASDPANYEDSELANAESIHWNINMNEGGNLIDLGPMTEEAKVRYDVQQRALDSLLGQRQDHLEACRSPGSHNTRILRIPGMTIAKSLSFWQRVAINALRQLAECDVLRGGILADVIGLGKTWVVIGYMLSVSVPDLGEAFTSTGRLRLQCYHDRMKLPPD